MDEISKESVVVTEDDISASLKRKEEINDELENDSISYAGSLGTLSNLSTGSALSLTALKQKRIKLIESIQSVLDSSNLGDACSTPNTSILLDERLLTSTPYKEQSLPPAAKYLKEWRCFSKIEEIAEKDDSTEPPIRYEEAFESLKEILGQSGDVLGAYESALDVYQKGKKMEEMRSFFEVREDTAPADILSSVDDNDNTIISISDTSTLIEKTIIEKPPIVTTDGGPKNKRELDPKDPENVIIAADDGANVDVTLVNEEDEDRLLASDDEEQEQKQAPAVATVESKKVWTEFVSNDPAENADNNDPLWEPLRNLGSDYERYLAVRQRWRNIDIPNPKKDLTYRCKRTAETSASIPLSESRKRPHSPELNCDTKRSKLEPCTMLFDRGIAKLLADLEIQKQKLDRDQEKCMNSLADNQRLEQMDVYYGRGGRVSEQEERALKDKHCKETYDLMRSFGMRRDHLVQSSRQKMQALRRAAAEVKEFHEFYPVAEENGGTSDKNALTLLTASEVEEILEVETMFSRYEEFYSGSHYEQQCH